MKLLRFGPEGQEKPGLLDAEGQIRDLSALLDDYTPRLLGREAWGQGYALEAMRAVLSYAATLGLRRLAARTHLGNLRSDALLEKLGFEEEGLLRGHVLRDGEHRDCRLFGLLL